MLIKCLKAFFALSFLFFFNLNPVIADGKPVLKVAVLDDFPPYYYRDKAGNYTGASYDIVEYILRKLGYEHEVSRMSSMPRLLAALGGGEQDLAINLTATRARSAFAYFTQTPHIHEPHHFIVRADTPIEYTGDFLTMSEYRFSPIFGWTYGEHFDRATYLNKVYVNNTEEQLKSLLSGGTDIALNNPHYFLNIAYSHRAQNAFRVLNPAVVVLPVNIGVSKVYPDAESFVQSLEKEVTLFVKQDAYREILQRHGFNPNESILDVAP